MLKQEFHPNGQLAYEETWQTLTQEQIDSGLYPNSRINKDVIEKIRIGTHTKYFDNSVIAWQLKYDEFGNPIKSGVPNRRKDGTVITY